MDTVTNETHQRLLDIAESLFFRKGYATVRLRDISDEIGIKHAAIYYYAPGGKEDLFVQVMERSLERHRLGLETVIEKAGTGVREQLQAVAGWLMSQPPFNLARMGESDFQNIRPETASRLSQLVFDSLRLPVAGALERAQAAGVLEITNPHLAAISFVSLVEIIHSDNAPYFDGIKPMVVDQIIDMFLNGWLKR